MNRPVTKLEYDRVKGSIKASPFFAHRSASEARDAMTSGLQVMKAFARPDRYGSEPMPVFKDKSCIIVQLD